MATPEVHHYYEEDKKEGGSTEIKKGTGKTGESSERTPDSSDAKIDKKKLSKFKEKAEYLQKYGGAEYQKIINDVMSQFDSDIKEILNRPKEKPKEVKFEDLTTKSDKQLEDEVTEILGQLSGKFEAQKAIIKKIYKEGSKDDIELLNKCINKCMKKIDDEFKSFIESAKWGGIPKNEKKAD